MAELFTYYSGLDTSTDSTTDSTEGAESVPDTSTAG